MRCRQDGPLAKQMIFLCKDAKRLGNLIGDRSFAAHSFSELRVAQFTVARGSNPRYNAAARIRLSSLQPFQEDLTYGQRQAE